MAAISEATGLAASRTSRYLWLQLIEDGSKNSQCQRYAEDAEDYLTGADLPVVARQHPQGPDTAVLWLGLRQELMIAVIMNLVAALLEILLRKPLQTAHEARDPIRAALAAN